LFSIGAPVTFFNGSGKCSADEGLAVAAVLETGDFARVRADLDREISVDIEVQQKRGRYGLLVQCVNRGRRSRKSEKYTERCTYGSYKFHARTKSSVYMKELVYVLLILFECK